ncbi:MAG: RNA 2',3'-cyclic phosphodiesterase [Actinomycetota bacterium]|nr:RNA 2',3'-cyclic phosphodiesterase [Actinomycetota bacterium]
MTVDGDRIFLAVALDDTARHAIATHLETSLKGEKAAVPGKKVPPENWHITLRFLGPSSAVQRDRIVADLDQHLMVDPFRIRFTELGGFPRESKASVLWMGVAGAVDSLVALAEACETAAQGAHFESEGRPFHPHLTLARVRPPTDIRPLVDLVPPARVTLEVTAVTLYRSILGQGPARYEVVDTIDL